MINIGFAEFQNQLRFGQLVILDANSSLSKEIKSNRIKLKKNLLTSIAWLYILE